MKTFFIAFKRCFFICLMTFACCASAHSQVMYMSDETTDVTFETKHMGATLEGTIKGVKGTALLDTNNMATAYLRFSLAPATFIHNENYVGPNLMKESCFDSKKNPDIELVSSSIIKLKGIGNYQFNGALIVKGKSRDISFCMKATPSIGGYDFLFHFPIVKKNYGLQCSFSKQLCLTVRAYAKAIKN